MVLDVELSEISRELVVFRRETLEVFVGTNKLGSWEPGKIRKSVRVLDHVGSRSSSAVAPAVRVDQVLESAFLRVVLFREPQLVGQGIAEITVAFKRDRGGHLRAVDSAPAEYVVRENGLSAPVDLIGVESGYAASPEYLRDVRLEAERVRQPRDGRVGAEVLFFEHCAVKNLSHD